MPPIKPSELKIRDVPEVVYDCFNNLIQEKFTKDSAVVYQKEIVALMVESGLIQKDIFSKGWLDIEEAYRKAGWKVEYDKPGYNESGEAFFRFTIQKNTRKDKHNKNEDEW